MGTKIFGHQYDKGHWNSVKSGNVFSDVAVAPASSNVDSDNYGLIVIPATKSGLTNNANPLPTKIGQDVYGVTQYLNIDKSGSVLIKSIEHQKAWEGASIEIGGVNDSIGTVYEDLSNFDQDNNYLSTTMGLMISSTAQGDRYNLWGSGSTAIAQSGGARVVRVEYLDSNWNPKTVDVYMSGQQPRLIASDIYRLQNMKVVYAGTSGAAAGDIYVGSANTQYLKIDVDTAESYGGFYYVPDGKNLVITDAYCYPRLDNGAAIEFAYRAEQPYNVDGTTRYVEQYIWAGSYTSGSNGTMNMGPNLNTPILVKDRCRIKMRARAGTAGTAKAIGYFKGYLVDKK